MRRREDEYRRRGCIVVRADFPVVELLFGLPKVRPSALLFGAYLDFTNYDAEPPSVRLVDPWTRRFLRASQLVTHLRLSTNPADARRLLQWWNPPDDIPFLCTRGVREYHRHPGHTGDSWWLHRTRGEGTLPHLVELLTTHGPDLIGDYDIKIGARPLPDGSAEVLVAIAGFKLRGPQPQAQPQLPGSMSPPPHAP